MEKQLWPNMYLLKLSFPSQNTSQKGRTRGQKKISMRTSLFCWKNILPWPGKQLIHELLSCNHHSSPWTHFADSKKFRVRLLQYYGVYFNGRINFNSFINYFSSVFIEPWSFWRGQSYFQLYFTAFIEKITCYLGMGELTDFRSSKGTALKNLLYSES